MRLSLTVLTAIFFGLCQQYCLLAHGCEAASEHSHTNADHTDHHHSHPNHNHSEDTPNTTTAVPCCSILKISETFSFDLTLQATQLPLHRSLDSTKVLIHLIPLVADSHHDPTVDPHASLTQLITSSLSIAPNAPPASHA